MLKLVCTILKCIKFEVNVMIVKKDTAKLPSDFPFIIGTTSVSYRFENEDPLYHWHDFLEISYIVEGSGYYYVNGKTYEMNPKDIIIFNNVEPHSWCAASNSPMKLSYLHFNPSIIWHGEMNTFDYQYLKPFTERSTNFSNKLPSGNQVTSKIYELLLQISDEFETKAPGYTLMVKVKLLEIMTLLIRHFQDDKKSTEGLKEKEAKLVRLSEVIIFLKENYYKNINLVTASSIACMNQNYFSTFFKDTMGISFVDYLSMIRINNAEILIKNTNLKLIDIALRCGFTSISNFNRSFKKLKGITPSEFRQE